jgi:hypothetical protein
MASGPVLNAFSTTSGKFIDGFWVRLHNSCEHATSMCMQWVQTNPISIVPNRPTTHPAFLNASGMAKIPVPMLPFRRWIIVSKFEVGCSSFLLNIGSSEKSSPEATFSRSTDTLSTASLSNNRSFSSLSLLAPFGSNSFDSCQRNHFSNDGSKPY